MARPASKGRDPWQRNRNTGYRLTSASDQSLTATYDAAGYMSSMTVERAGNCAPANQCSIQVYQYKWDEVGRLVDATRQDPSGPGAHLKYAYDSSDNRVRKTVVSNGDERHTIYVFGSLELRLAESTATGYTVDDSTEVPYLFGHGVRLARVTYTDAAAFQTQRRRIFLELGDHLGSTSVVLDRATGELVQRSTAYAYGAAESSYRTERWDHFREDYRFTGKEDDIEVGLIYFGARYLNPQLGRWISADPLAVHAPGKADLNLYAYVRGAVLIAIDPVGLQDAKPVNPNPGFAVTEGTPRGYPNAAIWVGVDPASPAYRANAKPAIYSTLAEANAAAQQVPGAMVFANATNMSREMLNELTHSWKSALGNAAGGGGKSATSRCAGGDCTGGGSMPEMTGFDSYAAGAAAVTGTAGADAKKGVVGGIPGGHGPKANAGRVGQAVWATAVVATAFGAEAKAGVNAVKGRLQSLASQIREAGLHAAARSRRVIAVGEDAAGKLYAGSSNGFDAGQRAAAEKLGAARVPSKAGAHAEENLMREVDDLRAVGTSKRAPCGPGEHNCAGQLGKRNIHVDNE